MLENAIAHFSERHYTLDLAVELIFEAPCSPPLADYGECARWSIFKKQVTRRRIIGHS